MSQKEVISGFVGEFVWSARVEPVESHRYLLDEVLLASGESETVGLLFGTLEQLREYAQEVAEFMVGSRQRSSDE